jgi:hypothetical protein
MALHPSIICGLMVDEKTHPPYKTALAGSLLTLGGFLRSFFQCAAGLLDYLFGDWHFAALGIDDKTAYWRRRGVFWVLL